MQVVRPTLSAVLVVCCVAAAAGCSKSDPAALTPAPKTPPPPVLPPPPRAAPSFLRDHYANLADCVYDWGYAQKCTPVTPGSPEHQAGTAFLGPIYGRGYREETQAHLRREALDGGYAQQVATDASDRSIRKSEAGG